MLHGSTMYVGRDQPRIILINLRASRGPKPVPHYVGTGFTARPFGHPPKIPPMVDAAHGFPWRGLVEPEETRAPGRFGQGTNTATYPRRQLFFGSNWTLNFGTVSGPKKGLKCQSLAKPFA